MPDVKITLVKGGLSKWALLLSAFFLLVVLPIQVLADTITIQGNVNILLHVPLSDAYKQLIAQNSTIVVDPASSSITSPIVVIVHISDGTNSLINHIVRIGIIAQEGVIVYQPTLTTDSNGYVRATITSSISGQFQVYAIDDTYLASDNQEILINQSPNIIFTALNSEAPSPTPFPTTFVPQTTITPIVPQEPLNAPTTKFSPSQSLSPLSWIIAVLSDRYGDVPIAGIILFIFLLMLYPCIWFFADADILLLRNSIFYTIISFLTGGAMFVLNLPYSLVILIWLILVIEFSRIIIAKEYAP